MKDTRETAKDYTDWHVKTGGFARDMTLRDEFAALAMQGAISHGLFNAAKADKDYAEYVSMLAYVYADEMLKERNK
jgi:hypothetical protein